MEEGDVERCGDSWSLDEAGAVRRKGNLVGAAGGGLVELI